MEGLDCLEYRAASPDFVLAVVRDGFSASQRDGEAESDFELTMDTTIAAWRDAMLDDFFSWRRFAAALNAWWRIDAPLGEWKAALTPTRTRTVRDVCELIARYARRPCFRPAIVFGRECLPAGAFLAIKSLLAQEGADVRDIAPSTPLREIARRHLGLFTGPVAWLAPGTVPYPRIVHVPHAVATWVMILSGAMLALGNFLNPWITIIGVTTLAIAFLASLIAAQCRPTTVEFPGLRTFRDLAKLLAAESTRTGASART
jgi:hypothetical protein